MNAPARSGASLNRHRSNTVVGTPREFLDVVERIWGPIQFDLACTRENCRGKYGYLYPGQDALHQDADWSVLKALCWLNPPYSNIEPWAKKCALSGAHILFLVPASVGSNWFAEWVLPYAHVFALCPRLVFEGHTQSYPKDLILAEYGPDVPRGRFECWRWK